MEAKMNENLKKQSNPFSTGGGGVNFETRVQAAFALSILTGSSVPCLSQSMRAKQIRFQNKYDGSNTDDFVIVAEDSDGQEGKLFAQIKHEVTLSESPDSVFAEVIASAWQDFKSDNFKMDHDVIVLITGPLQKTDIHNTLPILEWAKFALSAEDFMKKVQTKGFSSEAKLKKIENFRLHLRHASNISEIDDTFLWSFLKSFHLISYDLDSSFSVVASLLCSQIQNNSDEAPPLVLSKIITTIQNFNQNAGILSEENIPHDLKTLFNKVHKKNIKDDIRKLQERGTYIYTGISNRICGIHINRNEQLAEIEKKCQESRFVFVTGIRGVGKSGIVKDFISNKYKDVPFFYLRTEDLDKSHLNDVFTALGMSCSLAEIAGEFSLLKEKILIIESVEKVLELTYQNAFIDLLHFIKNQNGWTVIATGRDYATQQLIFNYLQPSGIDYCNVEIKALEYQQVSEICHKIPELEKLIENKRLTDLLKVPFFIDVAVRALKNGAQFHTEGTERDFREIIWSSVIAKETDRRGGMPAKRKRTFIDIAKQRAKKMVVGILDDAFDPEIIAKLEEDNLIQRHERLNLISPSHDVLEDWALDIFIDNEYVENFLVPNKFFEQIGDEPSINRAYRLWLSRNIKENKEINDFIYKVITDASIASYWKDETITAILQSDAVNIFLKMFRTQLLSNKNLLLIRVLFILRMTCQQPKTLYNQELEKEEQEISKTLYLQPYGICWDALINFIFENQNELVNSTSIHIIEMLNSWVSILNISDNYPDISRKVGLLAIWLLEPLKDSYAREDEYKREKVISLLLKLSPTIVDEFDLLMDKEVFIPDTSHRRLHYVEYLINQSLIGLNVPILCKYRPDFIERLARHEWLQDNIEDDDSIFYKQTTGVDQYFGLNRESDFFPASGAKGPFKYLLHFHPRKALDFIIDLCNKTAKKYSTSEFATRSSGFMSDETLVKNVELTLNDGTVVTQFSSPHLWKGYRGHSTLPYILQCALMALENWLIDSLDSLEKNDTIEWLFNYILLSSNSVMPTSVLASVATGFPDKISKAAFPILRCPEFYNLDIQRLVNERGGSEQNWFSNMFHSDIMNDTYVEERRIAALRPWRKETLESLLTRLQLSGKNKADTLKIVDSLIALSLESNDENLRFLVHRADTRTWSFTADKENSRIIAQSNPELPEDLQQIHDEHSATHTQNSLINKLFLWSRKSFEENINNTYFNSHTEALTAAKYLFDKFQNNEVDNPVMVIGTITKTAAVCTRDLFENLSEDEKNWCKKIIIECIIMNADCINGLSLHDKTDSYGSGACAFVLPKLFRYVKNDEELNELKFTLAIALTHENIDIGEYAAKGVREFLWTTHPTLAFQCIYGATMFARFKKENINSQRFYLYSDTELAQAKAHWSYLITSFREEFFNTTPPLIENTSLKTHSSWHIHLPILMIPFCVDNPLLINLYKKIVHFTFDEEYKRHKSNHDDETIQHDIRKQITNCFAEHFIHTRKTGFGPFKTLLLEGCSTAPRIVYMTKLLFHIAMEKAEDLESLWEFWLMLAPEAHKIALKDVNEQYSGIQSDLNQLLRGMLYADTRWQGHENEARDIAYGSVHILDFAKISGNNSHVFMALSSLIYHFHHIFFDEGIHILAEKLIMNSKLIDKQINTAFYLEMAIGRYLQIENRGILSRKMYNSCMTLLSGIVETGSARAYYLRENLIRSRRVFT